MNRCLCFLASLAVFALPPALHPQGSPAHDEKTAFTLQLKYVKVDFPGRSINTCIAVFPDGRFHLEQAWWGSFPDSGLQIFEGSLAGESVKSLSAILAADEFKKLKTIDVGVTMYQGQIVWAIVPRPEESQALFLVGREGTPKQDPKPLPQSIQPLVRWMQETRKAINRQKTSFVKGAKPVNCWLPGSWPTSSPAMQAHARNEAGTVDQAKQPETHTIPNSPETSDQQPPQDADEKKLYSNATTFVELPAAEMLTAIPELRGLIPARSQEELPVLMDKIGDKAVGLFRKMPNLICHEDVTETRQGRKTTRQKFDYLIVAHQINGVVTLEEYRVDLRDKLLDPRNVYDSNTSATSTSASVWSDLRRKSDEASTRNAGAPPLSEGFAYKWVHFYPSNRSESTFRYLGHQKIDGHKTVVIAFAQKPGSVRSPGELQFQGQRIPILYQGIAWVDESDWRIVRLRTDLLAPLEQVHLRRLTAEIHFGEARIAESASPLWLPREVVIVSEVSGQTFGERHVYSDYRAYLVHSKIVLSP